MNQRFEGWKLALVLLIPLAIIGAAVWIGISALSGDDDQNLAVTDAELEAGAEPTATALPLTQPVEPEPTEPAAPTAIPIPTARPVPSATPRPAGTPGATPAPTARPAPAATTPPSNQPRPTSGPLPTATPNTSIITVTCSIDGAPFAAEVEAEVGVGIGPFLAVVTPPEAAAGMLFEWNFGNNRIARSIQAGLATYEATGLYTVTLTASGGTSGEIVTTCGKIRVGKAVSDVTVTCTVAPQDTTMSFAQATVGESMTVTVRWTPKEAVLTLQYDFGGEEPIQFVENIESPNSKTWSWPNEDAEFRINWRHIETDTRGSLACPAYPSENAPAPTLEPTVTPGPSSTSTP